MELAARHSLIQSVTICFIFTFLASSPIPASPPPASASDALHQHSPLALSPHTHPPSLTLSRVPVTQTPLPLPMLFLRFPSSPTFLWLPYPKHLPTVPVFPGPPTFSLGTRPFYLFSDTPSLTFPFHTFSFRLLRHPCLSPTHTLSFGTLPLMVHLWLPSRHVPLRHMSATFPKPQASLPSLVTFPLPFHLSFSPPLSSLSLF